MHTASQVGTLTGKARPPCLLAAGTGRVFGIALGGGLSLSIATLTRGFLLGGASVVLALGHSHAGIFVFVVVAGVWRGGVLIVGVGRHAVFLTSAAAAAPACHHLPYFLLGPRCLGGPRCACRPPSIYSLCRSMERPTACSAQRSVVLECPPRDSVTRIASAVPRRASARSLLRSTCSSPLARANDACWRCVWRDSQRGGPGTAMLWSGRGADRASALDACLQVGTGSSDWDGDCDCCCVL